MVEAVIVTIAMDAEPLLLKQMIGNGNGLFSWCQFVNVWAVVPY
jgi:hypothetical protein